MIFVGSKCDLQVVNWHRFGFTFATSCVVTPADKR
jgi:hypothetical protein